MYSVIKILNIFTDIIFYKYCHILYMLKIIY